MMIKEMWWSCGFFWTELRGRIGGGGQSQEEEEDKRKKRREYSQDTFLI